MASSDEYQQRHTFEKKEDWIDFNVWKKRMEFQKKQEDEYMTPYYFEEVTGISGEKVRLFKERNK